jgi:hypothetical protein
MTKNAFCATFARGSDGSYYNFFPLIGALFLRKFLEKRGYAGASAGMGKIMDTRQGR